MMARRDREIELFSTSAIDLLSCGLAAMLVLWVLLLGNRVGAYTGDQEAGSARFAITQFKTSHLKEITVDASFELDSAVLPVAMDPASPNVLKSNTVGTWEAVYRRHSDAGTIHIRRTSSNGFGVRIEVSYVALKRPATIKFQLEPCKSNNEIHYLEIDSTDASGMREQWFGFHCEDNLEKFVDNPPTAPPLWLKYFQTSLASDARMWRQPFRYEVVTDCKAPAYFGVAFGDDGVLRASLPSGDVEVVRGSSVAAQLARWAGTPHSVSGI